MRGTGVLVPGYEGISAGYEGISAGYESISAGVRGYLCRGMRLRGYYSAGVRDRFPWLP